MKITITKPIIKNNIFLIIFIAITAILSGCVTSKVPSYFDTHTDLLTRQYSPAEIQTIHENFYANKFQYCTEFGRLMIWNILNKNNVLGGQVSKLPDLNDGIDIQDATALGVLYDYLKDINFPDTFPTKEIESRRLKKEIVQIVKYHALIKWSSEEDKFTNGSITILDNSNHLILKEVTPKSFEKGDYIVLISASFNQKTNNALIKVASSTSKEDEDYIEIKFTASANHKIQVGQGSYFVLGDDYKISYVSSKPVNKPITMDSQQFNKIEIIEDIAYRGLKNKEYRYNPYLEALFWLIKDENFHPKSFQANYNDHINFIKEVWGNMEGSRWEDFNSVVERLNEPELIDYFINTNIKYNRKTGSTRPVTYVFFKKLGDCDDLAAFGHYALSKAGYKTFGRRVYNGPEDAHIGLGMKLERGKYSLIVNFSPHGNKMSGPYDKITEIDGVLGYGTKYVGCEPFYF